MTTLPLSLVAAASAMTLGQLWKVISPLFRGRPPAFRNALQSGGMPSSHTAAAAAMAITAGFRDGFDSSVFAVALVLTAIVAHDAVKVRGSINTIIAMLKKITPPEILGEAGGLPDTVGHSIGEVVAGFVLAAAVALIFRLTLM
jgi:acid phosphatase family membrane protein YuiD